MEVWGALIGPLGFATKSLRRRGFHSYLAFLGLTLTVATTTFLLLLGQDLATRLGDDSSMRSTFGISWLIFAYMVASVRVRRIVGSSSVNAISKQLANLDLKSLGKPLRIGRFGSTFNLATRNVSRDRGFNKTLLSMGVCICLSMIVLSGALVSADTSASYVVRAMPPHVLIVANSNIYNQYVSLATSFSRIAPLPPIDYGNESYIISPQNTSAFRAIPGRSEEHTSELQSPDH